MKPHPLNEPTSILRPRRARITELLVSLVMGRILQFSILNMIHQCIKMLNAHKGDWELLNTPD